MLQALYCADTDDAAAPAVAQGARKRVSRLSVRRGRSVVHKNLEDNYGAVITANHEALAQILEQVRTLACILILISTVAVSAGVSEQTHPQLPEDPGRRA